MELTGRSSKPWYEGQSLKRFSHFWTSRNTPDQLIIDQIIPNNISIFIAYLSHRIGLTANHLSVGSGIFAIGAFLSAISLPADQFSFAVMTIFVFSALSFLLDCADGQLANATNTASKFGEFLDKGVDVASFLLCFGGFFGYLYRHFATIGDAKLADTALLIGFLFLLAHSARFFAWQSFAKSYTGLQSQTKDRLAFVILKNLGDHVVSLFSMFLSLVSPDLMFLLFGVQAAVHTGAYVRYFIRAYRISVGDRNSAR